MDIPTVRPPALCSGDTIGIIAPAGCIEQRETLEQGIAALERMGFRVRFEERIFQSLNYLAGDDSSRAEELMSYFEDPAIRAIIGLRGGYGCSRLIPLLIEKRIRPHPKLFMGFSDLTTLHLFFRRRFAWITIHGPMAASPALANMGAEQQQYLYSLLTDSSYLPSFSFPQLETWTSGVAEGRLIGGNLATIVASLGTPYEIKTAGKILFLEDLAEPPYKIDRMLTHLNLAGKLQALAGLLLGNFHECEPTQGNYTAKEVLRDILNKLKVPVLANFPAGHGAINWAIPLGAKARMDATSRTIEFLEPAVWGK